MKNSVLVLCMLFMPLVAYAGYSNDIDKSDKSRPIPTGRKERLRKYKRCLREHGDTPENRKMCADRYNVMFIQKYG